MTPASLATCLVSGQPQNSRALPFLGPIFEGFVASEILKIQINSGGRKEIYHFRDQQGLEVDFIVPSGDGNVQLIECRASRTVHPGDSKSLVALRHSIGSHARALLVHRPSTDAPDTRAIAPGVEAIDIRRLVRAFGSHSPRGKQTHFA